MGAREVKQRVREEVWARLQEAGVARFPLPPQGRIPNFQGAEVAAGRLAEDPWFQQARVVKVNPDAPQHPVRLLALQAGKVLVTPTPRLRAGFLLLEAGMVPRHRLRAAATIRGAFQYGRPVRLEELPRVDLVVVGSVAVTPRGARVGKGGGYSELEYALLREAGRVGEATPIYTTIHDLQLVESLPVEEHDVPVDRIFTPTRTLDTGTPYPRPPGILWRRVTAQMLEAMPLLKELKERRGEGFGLAAAGQQDEVEGHGHDETYHQEPGDGGTVS
jgi:5-formyltetrahydrofolate cyclo-ligase